MAIDQLQVQWFNRLRLLMFFRSERYGKYGQNGHCEKLVGPV